MVAAKRERAACRVMRINTKATTGGMRGMNGERKGMRFSMAVNF